MTDAEKQLTALMDAYGGMLMGLCSVTLGDRCLAEDALQEVFLRAYRASRAARRFAANAHGSFA